MSIGQFHNYSNLISRHKRQFQLAHKKDGFRDPDTTRFINENWETPVDVQGVLWFVTYRDFKRYPDFELTTSDIKIITTSELLNSFEPIIKDKLEYDGEIYYIKHIIKQLYYGNFYILLLTKVNFEI